MIGREIRTLAAEAGILILNTDIEQWVAYAESLTMGKTIFEWAPKSPAARDIHHLTHGILHHEQEDLSTAPKTDDAAALA